MCGVCIVCVGAGVTNTCVGKSCRSKNENNLFFVLNKKFYAQNVINSSLFLTTICSFYDVLSRRVVFSADWLRYDDECVYPITEGKVETKEAYMLFYVQRERK